MSPVAENIFRRLDDTRQRWWLLTLLTTTVMAVCLSLGLFLTLIVWDAAARFSQAGLGLMFAGWLSVTVVVAAVVARRLLFSQRGMEATARRVESEFPQVGSNLINLVQLAEEEENESRTFCLAAMDRAAASVENVDFHRAAGRQSRWKRFVNCMQTPRDLFEWFAVFGLLVALTMLCAGWFPNLGSAARRLLTPWQFTPSVGSVNIIEITPGSADVLLGGSLTITAKIDNPEKQSYRSALFITRDGQPEIELPMTADRQRQRYTFTLPAVEGPFRYRLEIGDSQSPAFDISVRQKPTIEQIEVTLRFPSYMGISDRTSVRKYADLKAPRGTVAQLRVRPHSPVKRGYYESASRRSSGRMEDDGTLVLEIPMMEDGTFTIHLVDDAGYTDPHPRVNRIEVLPDEPPRVQLLKPPKKSSAAPGDVLPLAVRALDDHGLSRLLLEMKPAGVTGGDEMDRESSSDAKPSKIAQWTDFQSSSAAVRLHRFELPADKFRPGQTVLVRAVVWDNRSLPGGGAESKPQRAATAWHVVEIVDSRQKSAADLARWDELRKALSSILQTQLHARVSTAKLAGEADPAGRDAMVSRVRAHQIDIRTSTGKLAKGLGDDATASQAEIKPILAALANGPMIEAVARCDRLKKVVGTPEFSAATEELAASQDGIIETLRRLLGVARFGQDRLAKEATAEASEGMPDDVRRKFVQLSEKLDEFQRQQKKVLEASGSLAKVLAEELSEEEKQKFKDLAATEDKWSRVMEEVHEELSKQPQQDSANPSLLNKLAEIQTKLEMAEDALLAETAEIAVSLEEAASEMAEDLKRDVEKRLPDSSDHQSKPAEEPPDVENPETPKDELPGELEDMIDELIEAEEELFDEMEDASSSSTESAGRDAKDEPISDKSAEGGAGNRLPNSNETGGQSGEGRSGESGGKVVDEEARGKEGGTGGEGPEGPTDGPGSDSQMESLAEKQAALRSKAEALDSQFDIANFHRGDLKQMLQLMAQVERDLRAGRYQDALRQRDVLAGGLGGVKRYLRGEFEIRRDRTSNLPGEIQKEILSGAADPSPEGWDELNQQYFKRLSD